MLEFTSQHTDTIAGTAGKEAALRPNRYLESSAESCSLGGLLSTARRT